MSRIGKRYGTCASEIGEDPGRKDKTPLCRAAQPSQNAHLEARIDGDGNHIKGPLRVLMDTAEQTKKSSDSMGTKHRVNHGIYVTYGGINRQLVEKNPLYGGRCRENQESAGFLV